jgi:hypothetical protein
MVRLRHERTRWLWRAERRVRDLATTRYIASHSSSSVDMTCSSPHEPHTRYTGETTDIGVNIPRLSKFNVHVVRQAIYPDN